MASILTLDLATRTGFAFWRTGMPRPMFGCLDLPVPKGRPGVPCLYLRKWMRDLHQVESFTHGVFETPIMRPRRDKKTLLRFLFGLAQEVETTMEEFGINAFETDHDKYMEHWCGTWMLRTDEGKGASVRAAQAKGWDVKDRDGVECHDVADALGLLDHFTYAWKIEVPWDNKPAPTLARGWSAKK